MAAAKTVAQAVVPSKADKTKRAAGRRAAQQVDKEKMDTKNVPPKLLVM